MAQGSSVTYRVVSRSRHEPSARAPSRSASISAWALGSCSSSRSLWPAATTSPPRTSTAPTGTSSCSSARAASASASLMYGASSGRNGSITMSNLSVLARIGGSRETSGRRRCCTDASPPPGVTRRPSMTPTMRLRTLLPALLAVLVVPASAAAQGPASQASYVPGEVVVRYERSADRSARAEVQRETGVGGPRVFAPRTRLLKVRDGQTVRETLKELRARPEVATAAPNPIARAAAFVPSDPGTAAVRGGWQQIQWNFLAGTGVDAPDAWQRLIDVGRPGGAGVTVAVLDTGIAYSDHGRCPPTAESSSRRTIA